MARRFTSASSELESIAVGAASGETFGPATWLGVVRRATDAWMSMFEFTTSADAIQGALKLADTGPMQSTFGTPRTSTATHLTADGWLLIGFTKTTGTTTPRAHKYQYSTGVWTQANMGGTTADMVATGAGGKIWVGRWEGSTEYWNGDVAAMCYISRVLTDSEIRSAAAGDWWRFNPRFWREYPSGVDRPVFGRSIGRDATRTIALTGTSRTAVADPPGFRFSVKSRRGS